MKLVRCCCGLLALLLALPALAQTDTEFWFVAPEVSKNNAQNFDIPIYLRITAFDAPATITISQPANPGFTPILASIPANGFSTVDFSPFLEIVENKPANTVLNYGLHILSTAPVSIYYEVASTYCNCNPELYTLKGKNALGTNFLIPTQNFFDNRYTYTPSPYNSFEIVATANNTLVTITPSKNIVGHAAGTPFAVTLDLGETYSAVATSQAAADHLFGSQVTADKPIAVTMSDDLLYGITGCADLVGDQLVPLPLVGQEYIAVKGYLTNDGDRAFVLATQNNTQLFADGNAVPVATLNAGQVFNHNLVNPSTYLTSDKPVYVLQTSGYSCELGGALLPPISCNGSTRVVFSRTNGQQLGMMISTHNGDQGSFLVNGDPSLIPASAFSPVPGTGGNWVAASLFFTLAQIPVGTIVSVINTSGTFHLGLLIGNQNVGCSYGYFSDFARLNLGPDLTLCQDSIRVLDAGPEWSSYQWSTGATTQTISVNSTGNYSVTVTDPGCNLSDTVAVTYIPRPVVELGNDVTICEGESHTFDAGACPGCTFRWDNLTTGTLNVGNGQTYTTGTAGSYRVTVTNPTGCTNADISQLFTVTPLVPHITINTPVVIHCEGSQVTFTADILNGGASPSYQWRVNGLNAGGNSPVFSFVPANLDNVSCLLTSSLSCTVSNPVYSNAILLGVFPVLPVSVSVTASATEVCAGTTVNFTADAVNGGTVPAYQWKVNSNNVSNASNATYAMAPNDGDVVRCELTSTALCTTGNPALSDPVALTVHPVLPVSVAVTASADTVCAGTTVNFTAIAVNGGTAPGYQWKVNASNASNASNATYAMVPDDGDVVTCELTSNAVCAAGSPALSNAVSLTVHPILPVSVAITPSVNPACTGTTVTFTATPVNGGTAPGYQWKLNSNNASTASNATFAMAPDNGDVIVCELTSDALCTTGNPALSNAVAMEVNPLPVVSFAPCFDTVTILNARPYLLRGGLPFGGTYGGPGVDPSTGLFTPLVAGTGLRTVTFTYINAYGCPASATRWIRVQSAVPFVCGSTVTDIRDGTIYPTVPIGTQCWMAMNLDYGNELSDLFPQQDNCTPERYSHLSPGHSPSSFYQWDEVMNYTQAESGQGLCPPGWHVPAAAEWDILLEYLHGPGQAASPLKNPLTGNGFLSEQAGIRYLNLQWAFTEGPEAGAMYWTSTSSGAARAVARGLSEHNPSVSKYDAVRNDAFSVRCLRDN